MAQIKINVDSVRVYSNSFSAIAHEMDSLIVAMTSIRNNLDMKISSSDNINAKISDIESRLKKQSEYARRYANFLLKVSNDFSSTDRNISDQANEINYLAESILANAAEAIASMGAAMFASMTQILAIETQKRTDSFFDGGIIRDGITELGFLGSLIGVFLDLDSATRSDHVGEIIAYGGKAALSFFKSLSDISSEALRLGKVNQILTEESLKALWQQELLDVKAPSVGDFIGKNGAVSAVTSWAGVAIDGVLNYFDNQKEIVTDGISEGRAIAETITETAVNFGKSAIVIGGAKAVVAALAIPGPGWAVAATIGIGMGVEVVGQAIFGESVTEVVSDAILDTGEKIIEVGGDVIDAAVDVAADIGESAVEFSKDVANAAVNCVENATKSIGAAWSALWD